MTKQDIGLRRRVSQQIDRTTFTRPAEIVRWMGAMQAQDYLGALWAVGLRVPGATEQAVEAALAEGAIVRTWPMRGTIHFVAAEDARWMLELLTPRVIERSRRRLRELELDGPTLAAAGRMISGALAGGRRLTRNAIYEVLEANGIAARGSRGLHILNQLSQQRLLCFGPREGKQPTFVLFDEWVPPAPAPPREEALAALALRYFTSHGPATLQDFAWWAGLTAADARAGLGAAAAQLQHERIDGQDYYAGSDLPPHGDEAPPALLPPFDEFLVAYRERGASLAPEHSPLVVPGGNGIFNPIVVIDGRVVGTWKRVFKRGGVALSFSPIVPWDAANDRRIAEAGERYSRFLGVPLLAEDG